MLNVTVSYTLSSPVTGLEWLPGFQEVKVPRFHDNDTGCGRSQDLPRTDF